MKIIYLAMYSEWHEDGIEYATGEKESEVPAIEMKEKLSNYGYWVDVK